jgi:hypothetical protein
MTEAPVLDAHRSDDGTQLSVWCEFCKRDHWHGRHDPATGGTAYDNRRMRFRGDCTCPVGTGDGHRVAHCHNPDSPYADTGYVLREVTR